MTDTMDITEALITVDQHRQDPALGIPEAAYIALESEARRLELDFDERYDVYALADEIVVHQ